MSILVQGIPTREVIQLRNGGEDAHGFPPQVHVAEGVANPCRHCLQLIDEGDEKLVFAYMPFSMRQPYAEVGPIFLHQKECRHYSDSRFPDWFSFLDPAIVRGYDENNWILYETGTVVSGPEIEGECVKMFQNKEVRYIHVRSKYNCFQCKVERA